MVVDQKELTMTIIIIIIYNMHYNTSYIHMFILKPKTGLMNVTQTT